MKVRRGKMTVEEAGRMGGEKTAILMVLNFTAKSVAKVVRKEQNNMKAHRKQRGKTSLGRSWSQRWPKSSQVNSSWKRARRRIRKNVFHNIPLLFCLV